MANKMLIDATHAEETRVVVVDGTKVEEFDFETLNKRQLAGNIYLAKVTRVEPSLQAAFIDYGGNRHGFLAFAEIHPDYYQIPAADRRALIEEERQAAEAAEAEEEAKERRRNRSRASSARSDDAVAVSDVQAHEGEAQAEETGDGDAQDSGAERQDLTDAQADHAAGDDAGERSAEAVEDHHAHHHADKHRHDNAEHHPEQGDEDHVEDRSEDRGDEQPAESASDRDETIESIAEEDVAEEIRPAKKPRARRYKIQEVIKVRQIMLVQVVKEERGNKGAALTTYLSLAGRYCVLMPNTARGGGISRKITNAADRKKLKDIASELEVPKGAGLIIRTAGSQRTRTEIKRDYEYLMRLWEQIRELTLKSIAPAPIYEEGDLIKRTIRDLYSKDIDEVLVEGERGYSTARDFMKMIMPSHAKNVKLYNDPMPLFARYQVEGYLAGMFNPVVQLKSGGYIVIGVTEALVAIDVNSGRATKEGSIEDTAYKTNCEAADEIARQLRLRDLAGLIVIDFIDMDERKNNASVEKRFKDRLKTDRARIQVGRISGFGLLEMSRQRLRPGMLESTTQPCAHCHGTGLIRSDDSMALTILRAIEEEGTRKRTREVLVRAPVAVANFLMNQKREHVGMIEARYGMAVRVEADPTLISPDFAMDKFKTATRNVPEAPSNVVSASASLMAQIDDEDLDADIEDEAEDEAPATEARAEDEDRRDERREDRREDRAEAEGDDANRSKRRRRRRRRGGRGENGEGNGADAALDDTDADAGADAGPDADGEADEAARPAEAAEGEETGRRSRSRSRRGRSRRGAEDAAEGRDLTGEGGEVAADAEGQGADAEGQGAGEGVEDAASDDLSAPVRGDEAPADMADADAVAQAAEAYAEANGGEPEADGEPVPQLDEPAEAESPDAPDAEALSIPGEADGGPQPDPQPEEPEAQPEPVAQPEPASEQVSEAPARPRRRGWWSFGS